MRYRPLFRLASGGMAEVWVARHKGPGGFVRPVAYKRMHEHLRDEESMVALSLDEVRIMGMVSHPNVVTLFDVGLEDDGTPFLVMELVVGLSLSKLKAVNHEPLSTAALVEIIAQAADGLHAAHRARSPTGAPLHIVHRDVSPQNILVGLDGRARISDFGVARADGGGHRTETGKVRGKIAYMAPEQMMGEPVTPASDLFSLAVVLWECITLERLFAGAQPLETVKNVLERPIPDVVEVRPTFPKALSDVIAHALRRAPAERFESGDAMAQALRAAAAEAGLERPSAHELSAVVAQRGGGTLRRLVGQVEEAFEGTTRADLFPPVATEPEVRPEDLEPTAEAPRRPMPLWIPFVLAAGVALAIGLAWTQRTGPEAASAPQAEPSQPAAESEALAPPVEVGVEPEAPPPTRPASPASRPARPNSAPRTPAAAAEEAPQPAVLAPGTADEPEQTMTSTPVGPLVDWGTR